VGDAVELEVVEDVIVDGLTVLPVGSKVSAFIAEAEPKKRFGHGGKLAFSITSIALADGEQVKVRCYQEASGSSNTSADAFYRSIRAKMLRFRRTWNSPLLVDGEGRLKRESFETPKNSSDQFSRHHGQKTEQAH